jgi:hypothetical protein
MVPDFDGVSRLHADCWPNPNHLFRAQLYACVLSFLTIMRACSYGHGVGIRQRLLLEFHRDC